jgi:hypothetical protein
MRLISLLLATAVLVPLAGVEPAAARTGHRPDGGATCPDAQRTERGYCQPPLALAPDPHPDGPTAAEKSAAVAALAASVAASGRAAILPHDPPVMPAKYVIPAVAAMRIFKEGEGNGKKSYTCGPSTTRNMAAALFKTFRGYYKDYGEHWFEVREGTKPGIGTSTDAIARVLNHYFGQFGSWTTWRPRDKYDYLRRIRTNTYLFHESIPVAVDTEKYAYFNGKALDHIHLIYGYDLTTTPWQVKIAEEWDPIYIYGHSVYGNTYGHQHPSNLEGYRAVTNTSFHMMVV